MTERPFTIAIAEEQLLLLQAKLDLTVFPDELDDAGWQYGVPLAEIKRLTAYWRNGYDWRKHEADLNRELSQFNRQIDIDNQETIDIHYTHQKSEVASAIPLLFIHGWPGSFIEARNILPVLTAPPPGQPGFDVVAFSLPGFGFSEAPKKKGFQIQHYAEVGHKLMLALGYNEYVTQGGDWGALITRKICCDYGGTHAKAWHTNMAIFGRPPHPLYEPISSLLHAITPYTDFEKHSLDRAKWFEEFGSGFYAVQKTRPQTLGYSLADSPVGLLAWIYEKLVLGTDNYAWTDDEVLTWISIYCFSRAGPAASLRIYYEVESSGGFTAVPTPKVPIGFSFFPEEFGGVPRSWLRREGNVVFEAEHTRGGHFAAYERPGDLASDLRKMFGMGGPAFGVVPGKTGYA
ncbi:hypothetical protein HGRIS_014227 [Hohenbuehelia grisea]|uniref:Epoxide hydrolase N-terminal domain-containing protein n=1 Tax=Hohenbuehelia grisea TaxID=104357 RepID=A0ABR3JSP8_9AGAR